MRLFARATSCASLARAGPATCTSAPSERPTLRIDGRLIAIDAPVLDDAGLRAFLASTFDADALARLDARGYVDAAAPRGSDGAPYRVHAYRAAGGVRVAIRLFATTVPAFESLGLPACVATLARRANGLVLFTGPTGSGKTTALATLVDRVNRTAQRVIVTIEDPIEYVHAPVRSVIAQCEIGRDAGDHADALRGALRADPDVIVVGEMRDRDTIAAALTAAETGHLVLATLHTNDAAQTVDRIVDAFELRGAGAGSRAARSRSRRRGESAARAAARRRRTLRGCGGARSRPTPCAR